MNNLLKSIGCLIILLLTVSCTRDDDPVNPVDNRSFTTDAKTDFFINRDGTVNILVTGEFTDDDNAGNVIQRGFVYGTSNNPTVGTANTVAATGTNPVTATFFSLTSNQTVFIRGFFEMEDGSFFYGNEIQASTNVDASSSRSITMSIKQDLFFQDAEGITPELDVTAVEKESPIDIGFEYSVTQDFSNSSITLDADVTKNIIVATYAEYITGLQLITLYYFRPYAKYADGTVTNGGTSTATFTTN